MRQDGANKMAERNNDGITARSFPCVSVTLIFKSCLPKVCPECKWLFNKPKYKITKAYPIKIDITGNGYINSERSRIVLQQKPPTSNKSIRKANDRRQKPAI